VGLVTILKFELADQHTFQLLTLLNIHEFFFFYLSGCD
jgi:hypothetical protein